MECGVDGDDVVGDDGEDYVVGDDGEDDTLLAMMMLAMMVKMTLMVMMMLAMMRKMTLMVIREGERSTPSFTFTIRGQSIRAVSSQNNG